MTLKCMEGWTESEDIARYFEKQLQQRQEPVKKLIDRGDSPVQQFYRGATVLVTGGSGFLGKQLIEKLFRSCEIKKMFVLLRSKKGRTIRQRLDYILKDRVFESVREKHPNFADRMEPVQGDITELKLGLSDEDWDKLTEQVDTIFHIAATVRFDSPLRDATVTNIRGTRETLTLARSCKTIKSFVHVSTAYTHTTKERIGKDVLEQFYEAPVSPELMIAMAENIDSERLDKIAKGVMKGWPNTYTFTKAIAEELIRNATDLPICVVRPPIVISSIYEPNPGWLDINAVQGPSGIVLGVILGIMHVFHVDTTVPIPMTPVDYVNNCAIAAGWYAAMRRKSGQTDVPVYTVTNRNSFVTWKRIGSNLRTDMAWRMSTYQAIWYCFLIEVKHKIVFRLLAILLHYIPAYIMDGICYVTGKKPKGVTSFVSIYEKTEKFTEIFNFFLSNTWNMSDDNVKIMLKNMTQADRMIFNCDVDTLDLDEMSIIWAIGVRKYIIDKTDFQNSADAYAKQRRFRILHYTTVFVFFLIVWKLFCCLWFLIGSFV